MSNTKFVVFSGGCYSGKTTTMKKAKEIFEKRGLKVVMLDELIRSSKLDCSIDLIRKSPSRYLQLQNEVIIGKIEQERVQHFMDEKCVVLCDRAITDSIFYLTFYVDKSQLTRDELQLLEDLYAYADEYAKYAFSNVYDVIFEFKPLNNTDNDDTFRPDAIDISKLYEHRMISTLNTAYISDANCTCERFCIDLNMVEHRSGIEYVFNRFASRFIKELNHGSKS